MRLLTSLSFWMFGHVFWVIGVAMPKPFGEQKHVRSIDNGGPGLAPKEGRRPAQVDLVHSNHLVRILSVFTVWLFRMYQDVSHPPEKVSFAPYAATFFIVHEAGQNWLYRVLRFNNPTWEIIFGLFAGVVTNANSGQSRVCRCQRQPLAVVQTCNYKLDLKLLGKVEWCLWCCWRHGDD